jgi:hypothetical protein
MPIIVCPKCQGKLRFPEDTPPRRVKCPTCGNIFLSSDGAPTAPAPAARSGSVPAARDSKDFELPMAEERPHRSRDEDDRRRGREDDDDDRGRHDDYENRGRRRRRDEDDDRYRDRDRSRRQRDDDDDDDRDRSRPRRDQEDDYEDRPRNRVARERAIEGQFNRASLACLLNFIGGWVHVAALLMVVFALFLAWAGLQEGLTLFLVLAGLLGIGHWLTSATGMGFLVSGPRERGALGLSIATASTAGLHLMIILIIGSSRYHGAFGSTPYSRAADIHWEAFVTQLTALPSLIFAVTAFSEFFAKVSEGSVLPVFANIVEAARMILFLLTLRAIMLQARDTRGAASCMKTMIAFAITAGGLLVLGLLFGILMLLVRPQARAGDWESVSAVMFLFLIVQRLALGGINVLITLLIKSVKSKIDYRR